jgi:hypothetical protein
MTKNTHHSIFRHGVVRLLTVAMAVSLPLLGVSSAASAHATKATKAHQAAKHHKKHKGGGGSGGATGSGTGSSPVDITVSVVASVIQVEANPAFAGDAVNIDSSQLEQACGGNLDFLSVRQFPNFVPSPNNITTILDNDGNATVFWFNPTGNLCAPGEDVVEADLEVAPFITATTVYTSYPDVVTPEGAFAIPDPEVETGDTASSGDSNVYADFIVETNPVYAEGEVEISDPQLADSCIRGSFWLTTAGPRPGNEPVIAPVDDDGNVGVLFFGVSCAATTTDIVAEVLSSGGPTYVGSYTVLPPQPTI